MPRSQGLAQLLGPGPRCGSCVHGKEASWTPGPPGPLTPQPWHLSFRARQRTLVRYHRAGSPLACPRVHTARQVEGGRCRRALTPSSRCLNTVLAVVIACGGSAAQEEGAGVLAEGFAVLLRPLAAGPARAQCCFSVSRVLAQDPAQRGSFPAELPGRLLWVRGLVPVEGDSLQRPLNASFLTVPFLTSVGCGSNVGHLGGLSPCDFRSLSQ